MRRPKLHDIVSVPRAVLSVPASASPADALHFMRENEVHHLVVTRDGRLAGVVSDRDLFTATKAAVSDHMVALTRGVSADTRVVDALDLMEEAGASALPIESEAGVVGIVTERDLLRAFRALVAESARPSPTLALAEVALGHPFVQGAMNLAAQAGI